MLTFFTEVGGFRKLAVLHVHWSPCVSSSSADLCSKVKATFS
jgi:hypothetical protein